MTLDEKLTFCRYATLDDFCLGLHYEIAERYGNEHKFKQRSIKAESFIRDAGDFKYAVDHHTAIVPSSNTPSDDYLKASFDGKDYDEVKELLKEYEQKTVVVEPEPKAEPKPEKAKAEPKIITKIKEVIKPKHKNKKK